MIRVNVQEVVFMHNKERLHEALGIADDRAEEIVELIRRLAVESSTISEIIGKILNHDKLNNTEKTYTIFVLGWLTALQDC